MRFLDPATLQQIGSLPLRARAVVDGALAGLHRAPHHGSSIEFAEHKVYTPGDEIKHVDWKAFGKFDKYYVKRFESENELRGLLCVDTSGSMGYRGTRAQVTKLEYASTLAASLAWLLLAQRDKAGLVAFGERVRAYVPARATSAHLHELCGALEAQIAEGPTGVAAALDHVAEAAGRRALVVLLSDLFEDPALLARRLALLRARRHEVVVFQVLDPDEVSFPFEGLTFFEAMEGPDRRLLVDARAARATYLRELARHLARCAEACAEARVSHRVVTTDEPPGRVLVAFLGARA
jgi:uncharacterized protein (DUF58 family)